MRTLTFDQFEFDDPSTEERLELALAPRTAFPFPSVASFIAASVGQAALNDLRSPVAYSDQMAYGLVRRYLSQFASVEVPEHCGWPCYVFADGPDHWQIVIEAPEQFILYGWSTSA
jgi:hypothetical protein